jgi:bifunctional UDP-N-acetylglucosamine pyrophosphorylase/glucosamine-1-phosphate N-acetyltransferase
MTRPLHIVILAAGEGTRMKSGLPKVLHSLGGRPMLTHLLDTAAALEPAATHVVVGNGADTVESACSRYSVNWVLQSRRQGTGHAVMQAMPHVPDEAAVLVLLGDHPLIPLAVLREMTRDDSAPLAVLTMFPDDPAGYGRVVRDQDGEIMAVVEDRDATPEQREFREVNTGIMLAEASRLRIWLDGLSCDNAKGEYYLTDIFSLAHAERARIRGVAAPDARDLQGANDRRQLAELERRYQARRAGELMDAGVQIMDPGRVDIRGRVESGADVRIDVNVILEGDNRLGDGVALGPGCVVRDCELAAGTTVHAHSVLEGVTTTGACDIGPFARLRPGTVLSAGCKIGNFVEAKNARLGEGTKASHLTYLGDSEIGRNVNIGAGTITCNYDGANKHRTTIEDNVFVGSNTALVAPVTVHQGATIGAGSTISKDAPAETLTVSRARQASIKGWKRPRKNPEKKR